MFILPGNIQVGYTIRSAHPKITNIVFKDRKYRVMRQTVFRTKGAECFRSRVEHIEALQGTNPNQLTTIFLYPENAVVRERINIVGIGGVMNESSGLTFEHVDAEAGAN